LQLGLSRILFSGQIADCERRKGQISGAPGLSLQIADCEECASRQGGECRRRVKMQENQISAQVPLQNTVDWHGVQFALRLQIAQFLSLWVVTFLLHSAICLQISDFRLLPGDAVPVACERSNLE
jgi:hypothetical protein